MENPDNFALRLGLALKALNVSPARLSTQVGVDKSVVSRWLSGQALPTAHNLSRIGEGLAKVKPGFNALLWERPLDEFEGFLGLTSPEPAAAGPERPGRTSIVPAEFIDEARRSTERHGAGYEGLWSGWRPDAGHGVRGAIVVYRDEGLLRVRAGEPGVEAHGYLMPFQEHIFVFLHDVADQTPSFLILNGVAMPRVEAIDGLCLRLISGGVRRTPIAFPIFLERVGDLDANRESDLAWFEEAHKVVRRIPIAEIERKDVRDFLFRDVGPAAAALGGDLMLAVPLLRSLGRGVMAKAPGK